jgi:hypothetical protein
MTTLSFRHAMTAIGAGLVACAISACALARPQVPEQLGDTSSARIGHICETVMGLRPSDRPVSGVWPGNPPLPAVVSHYETCVISLSDSLQQAQATEAAQRADVSCRATGLASNSPELAVCVLQSLSDPSKQPLQTAASTTANTLSGPTAGSFYYASAHEAMRREQLACAELGFEPPSALFAGCVKNLSDNLFAIDNPIQ